MHEAQGILQIQDIIQIIKTKKFVIYGNGFVGKRLFRQVQKMGCTSNIVAIAVTKLDDNGLESGNVKAISDLNRDNIVFIAVHDASVLEIKNKLDELEFTDYIWIYPFLLELELGNPVWKNVSVNVCDLFVEMHDLYMPAVYYFSLEDYCNDNIYHGDLYIKAVANYTTLETGKKRWERFCDTINRCCIEGFEQDYNIKVAENYKLIDGLHRLVLARYFGATNLLCDVYHCDEEYYAEKELCERVWLTEKELKSLFSIEEIGIIENTATELRL